MTTSTDRPPGGGSPESEGASLADQPEIADVADVADIAEKPDVIAALAAGAASAPQTEAFTIGARRFFFQVAACLCAVGALVALVVPLSGAVDTRWLAALFAAIAAATTAALRMPPRWQPAAMTAFMVLVSTALAVVALAFRGGAGDAALGMYGVLVCVLSAASGRRAGWWVAAYQGVLLVALHLVWWPAGEAETGAALARLALHSISVATGVITGHLVAHSLARHIHAAAERERRFRRLLALAADAYWETDRSHRLVAVADPGGDSVALEPQAVGHEPWALPAFACDPEVLDRLRADLDAREPVRDVPVRWARTGSEAANPRNLLVSGAPRTDEQGRFAGYWGVVRDVTEAQAARATLLATESRYRDLFALSPAALVVHREGRVLDANPAALALFGHDTLAQMLGTHLHDSFEDGDSRERSLARLAELRGQPVGRSLPVTEFRLQVGGRRLAVRGTGVCIEFDGEPAVLSILADDTQRLAAEQSVRRSQAMLSHLVATTPDLVVVSELATGRQIMVNPAFEREFGWSAAEAVGRTAFELGIWPRAADRDTFVQKLLARGELHNEPLHFRARNGAAIELAVSAARFTLQQGDDAVDLIVMTGRDINATERLRLEREAILTNASVGIAVTRSRRFVLANRHFEAMLGWEPGELLGQIGRVVWRNDEDYEGVGHVHGQALLRGERVDFECRLARKDGRDFLAHMRAHAIDPARPQDGGTVWIVEDITARREAEQALLQARRAAEAANQAKSAFLANTSHELRTPLNGIVGLAALASDPALGAAERQRHLEQIVDSARSLTAIISDILDLSKIEAGRLEVEATAFDLGELLQAMRQTYAPQASARGLALHFDIGAHVSGGARGDPLRLRQVIGNFVANALKFTATGAVTVRALRLGQGADADRGRERSGECVRFEVHDTGPGIDAPTCARLFRPFSQADGSTTRRFGGTGLGLSISRELATLMGGEVGVQSEPGRGSCFWLEVPLPEENLPPAPPVRADGSLQGMRVLMVEDNHVNMLIATAMLESWGVSVEPVTDGAMAVQALRQALAAGRLPDAVLMDVQMPVMNGYEATRLLRAMPGVAQLPIVALTAAAMVHEREQAHAAGMDDFLTKPIDPERLRAALARWRQVGSARALAKGVA